MMEQDESLRLGQFAKSYGLGDRAVAPANTRSELVLRILPVVNQKIDTRREVEARGPAWLLRKSTRAECGLVIGQIGDAHPVGSDPVADGRSTVDDMSGDDLEAADVDRLVGRVVHDHVGVEITKPYREER